MELVEKLKDCFDEMLVYKDLKKRKSSSSQKYLLTLILKQETFLFRCPTLGLDSKKL